MTELLNMDGPEEEVDETPVEPDDGDEQAESLDGEEGGATDVEEKAESGEEEQAAEAKESEEEKRGRAPVPYKRFEEVVRDNQQFREKQARLDGRMEEIKELIDKQREAQVGQATPDREEDPEGYLAHVEAENQRLSEESRKFQEESTQNTKQQEALEKVQNYASENEARFSEQNPDYYEAAEFAAKDAVREEREKGETATGAASVVNNFLLNKAAQMQQSGGDFARFVYSEALRRGFKAEPEKADDTTDSEAVKELQKTAKAKAANKSIANAGGAPPPDLTDMNIDDMSDEEFDKFKKTVFEKVNPLRA